MKEIKTCLHRSRASTRTRQAVAGWITITEVEQAIAIH